MALSHSQFCSKTIFVHLKHLLVNSTQNRYFFVIEERLFWCLSLKHAHKKIRTILVVVESLSYFPLWDSFSLFSFSDMQCMDSFAFSVPCAYTQFHCTYHRLLWGKQLRFFKQKRSQWVSNIKKVHLSDYLCFQQETIFFIFFSTNCTLVTIQYDRLLVWHWVIGFYGKHISLAPS